MGSPRVAPEILVLDDERVQLATLRAQLSSLGNVRQFDDPAKAFEYLQSNPVDVAVVDIRMPKMPTDGMDFIEKLRALDANLAVVIRTADEGASLADRALEHQVFRRLIKSRTTLDVVQRVIKEGIAETRNRRKRSRAADQGALAKTELLRARGAIDDHISIARACRALLHSQRTLMTASAAYADALSQHGLAHEDPEMRAFALQLQQLAARDKSAELKSIAGRMLNLSRSRSDPELGKLAQQNLQNTARVVRHTQDFLASPLFEQEGQRQVSINRTLDALGKLLEANPQVQAATPPLVTPLAFDMLVATTPQKLLTALRHVIEFCYARKREQSPVTVQATYVEHPRTELTLLADHSLVFNRQFAPNSPAIKVSVSAQIDGINLAALHEEFINPGSDPQHAALLVYAVTLTDAGHMFVVSELSNQMLMFESYLPPST